MDAFVYLRVRPGKVEDVVVQLENVGGVRAAVAVVGAWDVLAAVQGPDLLGISEEVVRGIHLIEGVERTSTTIALASPVPYRTMPLVSAAAMRAAAATT